MGMRTTWQLKKVRKAMFKDLERVIKARNTVIEHYSSHELAMMVAQKIEEYSLHYSKAIGIMREELSKVEEHGVDIDNNRFLYNYRALKDDTVEVVSVMFEMYTDVYNKIKEMMDNE